MTADRTSALLERPSATVDPRLRGEAPNRAALEAMAAEAAQRIASRPARLAIVVRETPNASDLAEFGLEASLFGSSVPSAFDLLGRIDDRGRRLTLYRRPILDLWAESGAELQALIADVVSAELAKPR